MPEVELIIKAVDSDKTVSEVRKVQNAYQDLHNSAQQGQKQQKETVESLNKELDKLYQSQKKGFSSVEAVKEYEKRLADVKKKLDDVSKATRGVVAENKKVDSSVGQSNSSWGGFAAKLGVVGAAVGLVIKLLKSTVEALKDTVVGLNVATYAGEMWKQMAYNIATGNLDMTRSFVTVAAAASLINKQRKEERKSLVENAKLRLEYSKYYFESSDRTKSAAKQIEALNSAQEAHNKLIDNELRIRENALLIVQMQLVNRPKSNKLLDEEAKLLAEIIEIEERRYSEITRNQQRKTELEKKEHDESIRKWHEEIEESNKAYEKAKKAKEKAIKLQKEAVEEVKRITEDLKKSYEDMLLETSPITASFRMQKDFAIRDLQKLKTEIIKNVGVLTPEQEKYFDVLARNINEQFEESLGKEIKPASQILSDYLTGQKEGLQAPGEVAGKEKLTSVWQLLGIDPESDKGQEQIAAIEDAANRVKNIISEVYDTKVENAERERELLDRRIAESQRELDMELELYEDGYANNISAKQQEIAELKKQRDIAFKEEQEAIKKQQAFERISQMGSLITSVANILKTFTKMGPVGLVLASVAIGTLYAIFAAAKARAAEATKLAAGGSGTDTGMITGKRHSEGGEHFLSHVEVERGERWGVLNRQAAEKFGNSFDYMVSSFNKGEMPDFSLAAPIVNTGSVTVDNKGPNTRLDRLIKINEQKAREASIQMIGQKQIIKRGNSIRIIG